jgi:hypothetical protein
MSWVTLDELIARLSLTNVDPYEQAQLTGCLASAQSWVQDVTGLVEAGGQYTDYRLDLPLGSYQLTTRYRPIQSITAYSRVRGGVEQGCAVVVLDDVAGVVLVDPPATWPPTGANLSYDPYIRRDVRLVYTVVATPTPPARIKEACLELAASWYQLAKAGPYKSESIGDLRREMDADLERRIGYLLRGYCRAPV